ncbi:MAG: hypothetical protein HY360_11240 [Verrucomicrobia bacterium]|nr:hypothetical protein [Verrucomicrobiota bacterium]
MRSRFFRIRTLRLQPGWLVIVVWIVFFSVSPAAEQVIEAPNFYNGAMLVNSKARKLYAGWGAAEGEWEKGLWVFDIQPDGSITGSDERTYPNSPDPFLTQPGSGPNTFFRMVGFMLLSPDGRRLYLGVAGCRHAEKKPLVVYDLDEKGEPKGKPRAYQIGNFHLGISHMLLHPRLPLLLSIGWGGTGLFMMPLKQGEPAGDPQLYGFGYNAKSALIPSDHFDALIFAVQGGVVEVGDLNPAGELEMPVPAFKIPQGWTDALRMARVGRCLYFARERQLWMWPLDKEWRPIGDPKPVPQVSAISVWEGVHPSLHVVIGEFEEGEKGKSPRQTASWIARFKPDASGDIGKPVFLSEKLDHKTVGSMTVDEATGEIFASTSALP